MLQTWRKTPLCETPTLAEPRAFLTVVAKRVLFNHYRRQDLERAYLQALAEIPEQVVPSEEERAIILQTLMELDQLLDGLPCPVKRAFLLAQIDGLSHADIGARLGISVATVKRHLTKAALRCYFALCAARSTTRPTSVQPSPSRP